MTVPDIEALFAKYYTKGLLLDTNLFLLLLVGSAAPAALLTFKPTVNQGFTRKDFELLAQIATRFSRLITTPHILTEVCNHSDKLKGPLRAQVFGHTLRR